MHFTPLILLSLTVLTGAIRPATIVPQRLPEESHTIELLSASTGHTLNLPPPKLTYVAPKRDLVPPPAHISPEPSTTTSSEKPARLHARSFIPDQIPMTKRTPSTSASHGQPIEETISKVKAQLQTREFVVKMLDQLREAAVHKREVERMSKMARRAKTEAAIESLRELVNGVVRRREMERQERIVREVKKLIH